MDDKRYDIRVFILSLIGLLLFTLPIPAAFAALFILESVFKADSDNYPFIWYIIIIPMIGGWGLSVAAFNKAYRMKNWLLKMPALLISFLIIGVPFLLLTFILFRLLSGVA